jgi:hypothetical protein
MGKSGAKNSTIIPINKWLIDVLSLNSSLSVIFISLYFKIKSAHSSGQSYLFLEKVDLDQIKIFLDILHIQQQVIPPIGRHYEDCRYVNFWISTNLDIKKPAQRLVFKTKTKEIKLKLSYVPLYLL